MLKSNIWIINHYAVKGSGRHGSLARSFQERGHKTSIILSSFIRGKGEYLYEEKVKVIRGDDGVDYVYIHSNPCYFGNGTGRILNMFSFCWIILINLKYIKQQIGKPDHVIASSVHPFVWEIGYKIAKKFKAKFIAEIRDIWPLSLIEVAQVDKRHPFVKLLSIVERRAYKRSDAIVSTMPYAYKHICGKFGIKREKVHWMPNGIDVKEYERNLKSDKALPVNLEIFYQTIGVAFMQGALYPVSVFQRCLKLFRC